MKLKVPKKRVSDIKSPPKEFSETIDDLVVKRKGGGSIIDKRPLFSSDSETLYVVWKQVIRAYSTQTGDFVREFEPTNNKIAGITSYKNNLNIIVGCTETGDLINWNSQNGLITKKLKLKIHDTGRVKTFHIVNYTDASGKSVSQVLVSYCMELQKGIRLTLFDLEAGENAKTIFLRASPGPYDVDIIGNNGENLIALVRDVDLHIFQPAKNLSFKTHKIGFGGRKFTCVTGHPEEDCVATGDTSGRVAVWKNTLNNRPIQASYHWHTLPVTQVAFSISGGHMYTGGSECVLVKWTLANPLQKTFLPRLPAPITHLSVAPENLYVAVSTLDNGIIVVNPQRKITAVIQNFTWGVSTSREDLFPAGLTLDPRTGSLVLNSRTGYVQFFDTNTKSLLYNINITAQNLNTQQRNAIIVNTEVTKIALNHDGSWMATVEERDDKVSSPEVRLKFWKFDPVKQIYSLNTCIELPHDWGVNALQFQPNTSLDGENILAITTGKDNKFKLWNLVKPTSIYKHTKHWQCYSVGTYQNLEPFDAGFAVDGSLLAVSFGSSLTIWIPDSNSLKCSLTHSRYPQKIKRIEFGKNEVCHLVVVASSERISVWNLLTLSITWTVPLKFSTLTSDPNSSFMAAFTGDNTLFVFSPQSSKPVYTKKNLLEDDSTILGAIFVPNAREKRGIKNWQRKSQLFFLDSSQELLTLESESEATVSLENLTISGSLPATAFSSLIAAETSSNVEKVTPFFHDHLDNTGKGIVEELLTVSAHTLPPMRRLCAPFLLSLRAQSAQKAKVQEETISRKINGSSNDSEDENNDEKNKIELREILLNENKPKLENDDLEMNTHLSSYDWNFLASLFAN